jgi:hypothetical protein
MPVAPTPTLEVLHAAVPGRLRLKVPRLRGDTALASALESRWQSVASVRGAAASVSTGSVLLSCDPARDVKQLVEELGASFAELLGGWQRPFSTFPSLLSTLPLRETTVRAVAARVARLAVRLGSIFPGIYSLAGAVFVTALCF